METGVGRNLVGSGCLKGDFANFHVVNDMKSTARCHGYIRKYF